MRIVLHDFPGHSFPVQLSRALAARGHEVLHLTFDAFSSPKGPLKPRPDDPPGLHLETIDIGGGPFAKYNYPQRVVQEYRYARALCRRVAAFKPDVVFGGNAPLDPQAALQALARRNRWGFVFWLQDVYGVAIDSILRRQIPLLGAMVGWRFKALEKRLWRQSDALIAITDDFVPLLTAEGIDRNCVFTVENWSNMSEILPCPRRNPWSTAHGLDDKLVFLYSGTLGLKHNPGLLAALARHYRGNSRVRVVVITEGVGGDWLAERKRAEGLDNLILLPFQPYEQLSDVVGSGDALVVLLEPDAGVYSVPSKTLTYLCAARPILGSIPPENLAARLLAREGAGLVAAPEDEAKFLAAADQLLADGDARAEMGRKGRAYAETAFDIDRITGRIENVLRQAAATAKTERA